MAVALASLTLPDYVLQNYYGEGVGCRIARRLFAFEFSCLLMSHRSRPILKEEGARIVYASTTHAVHSLIEPMSFQVFTIGQFTF